jgi:hypothetical protein
VHNFGLFQPHFYLSIYVYFYAFYSAPAFLFISTYVTCFLQQHPKITANEKVNGETLLQSRMYKVFNSLSSISSSHIALYLKRRHKQDFKVSAYQFKYFSSYHGSYLHNFFLPPIESRYTTDLLWRYNCDPESFPLDYAQLMVKHSANLKETI